MLSQIAHYAPMAAVHGGRVCSVLLGDASVQASGIALALIPAVGGTMVAVQFQFSYIKVQCTPGLEAYVERKIEHVLDRSGQVASVVRVCFAREPDPMLERCTVHLLGRQLDESFTAVGSYRFDCIELVAERISHESKRSRGRAALGG